MVFSLKNKTEITSLFLFGLVFVACEEPKDSNIERFNKEPLVKYQPSEMAELMREFYSYNEQLKKDIIAGNALTDMPEDFKAIHSAAMTDAKSKSDIFKAYAPVYINTQKLVLDSVSLMDLKTWYNNNINVCLSCHKTECIGPIPRIKKLLIQ